MDYMLNINIPIDAKDDNDARKRSLFFLKWLSMTDGTVTLYEIIDDKKRRVLIKEKVDI